MFPNVQELELSTREKVKYFDLTLGDMDKLEADAEFDTLKNIILAGTELKEDEVDSLRRADAQKLYDAIIRATYPEMYNEDGSIKEIVEEALKKKLLDTM